MLDLKFVVLELTGFDSSNNFRAVLFRSYYGFKIDLLGFYQYLLYNKKYTGCCKKTHLL